MYYTKLIAALIAFLEQQGFVWNGSHDEFYSLMYNYQGNKVSAIKYFRSNMVKEEPFYMDRPDNVTASIAVEFAYTRIMKQYPLGLKEAKDLLDLVNHNSTY